MTIKEAQILMKSAKINYLKKSYEERVKHWASLHQGMRWQVESGLDEYIGFSKKWLEEIKEYEPDIESILEVVFEKHWKGYWDINEIKRRLKE